MLNCVNLLNKLYTLDSDIEDTDHDRIESFLRVDLNDQYNSLEEVYDAINQQKLKKKKR